MTTPNQKIVVIQQKAPTDKNNLYTPINLQALQKAAYKLKGDAFKLWIYFSQNATGFSLELSRIAINKWGNVKKDSYYRGIKTLEEEGYLTLSAPDSNIYYFTQIPSQKTTENKTEENKPDSQNKTEQSEFAKNFSQKTTQGSQKSTRNIINNINNNINTRETFPEPFPGTEGLYIEENQMKKEGEVVPHFLDAVPFLHNRGITRETFHKIADFYGAKRGKYPLDGDYFDWEDNLDIYDNKKVVAKFKYQK